MSGLSTDLRPALAALGAGGFMALGAFYQTDVEVYLFPRITAVLILVLGLILLLDALKQRRQHTSTQAAPRLVRWSSLWSGLAVGVVYVLLIEHIGFYTGSFLAFFSICLLYGQRHALHRGAFVTKLASATITILILYGLFWVLLHVRTPTGLLI